MLIAAGAAIVFEPALLGRIAVAVGGVLVVILGLAQLSGNSEPREEAVAAVAGGARPRPRPWAPAAAVVLVVVATGLAMAVVLPGPRIAPVAVAGEAGGCNGLRAMCDRRLDQVVMAATHNSYAAADEPGWLFANQRFGIARQLRDGVRALLIDVHLGAPDPGSGRIRTDLAPRDRTATRSRGSSARPRCAPPTASSAGRASADLVGRRQPYLCHTLCELGAEPLDQELDGHPPLPDRQPAARSWCCSSSPTSRVATIETSLRETDPLGALRPSTAARRCRRSARSSPRTPAWCSSPSRTAGAPWYLAGFRFVQDTPLGARARRS